MENKTFQNIILFSLLFIFASGFTFLMVAYVAPMVRSRRRKNGNQSSISGSQSIPITDNRLPITCSSSNTDFYKKSVEHAENILFGKIVDPQYGEQNYYGNKLIDTINKINIETKQSAIIAIQYFSIEPTQARANEQLFRAISQQEGVPLWFIILREAMKKAVPEFSQELNTTMQTENKIVPLYQRTG